MIVTIKNRATWLSPLSVAIVAALAILITALRAVKVQRSLGEAVGCNDCFILPVIANDLWLISAIIALGGIGLFFYRRIVRTPIISLMLSIVALMAADVLVYSSLSVRLYISDIAKFGGEVSAINQFLMMYFEGFWPLLFVAVASGAVLLVVVAVASQRRHTHTAYTMLAAAGLTAAVAASNAGAEMQYVHDESIRNFVAINFDQGVSRPFSKAFIASNETSIDDTRICAESTELRPNILLVIVESLSAYHSALLGGKGWTPEIDNIALHGSWFTNFHANGFTTDHGLIALLTGRVPLPSVGRYGSTKAYEGFESPAGSVPTLLRTRGYKTLFFTTGDLGFLDKGSWAREIGFDHVEGAEAPFYDGKPRYHFNAAADQFLFDRFIQWYEHGVQHQPFFVTLLTVSSHPPFIDPESGRRGEEEVIRYVDRELGRFFRKLREAGFFNNGLLLITGDHRAMAPITREEKQKYGDRALSRIPMIVVGQSRLPSGPIETLAQQVDLVDSLDSLLGGYYCRRIDHGTFLSNTPEEPRYIIHVRGDRRSWLSVYTDNTDAILHLNGDKTKWLNNIPPDGQKILQRVNAERIQLGQPQQDLIDYIIQLRTPTIAK